MRRPIIPVKMTGALALEGEGVTDDFWDPFVATKSDVPLLLRVQAYQRLFDSPPNLLTF